MHVLDCARESTFVILNSSFDIHNQFLCTFVLRTRFGPSYESESLTRRKRFTHYPS